MKIYVDILFLINLIYDFLILNLVNIVLRRYVKVKRLFYASLIGTISSFSIFVPKLNNIYITIIISIIMVIFAFGIKDVIYFKNNIIYFYMISIIFGGFLYFVNLKFNHFYTPNDIYQRKMLINIIGIIFYGLIVYFLYIYAYKINIVHHQNYYDVKISMDNIIHDIKGFYDSGNLIKDPYKGRPIILISKKVLNGDIKNKSPIYVPCFVLNSSTLLECYKPSLLIINNHVISDCLVGILNNNIFYDGIDAVISGYMGDKIR